MAQRLSNDQGNDLPPPFFMWEMMHSTITAIFKNLDNAEGSLKALAETLLSSKECSDIFVPRYDTTLTNEQNTSIEKTYQSFTTWLLGRLFYILSCEKFERIHHLFIEAQQKILVVLKGNQSHVYNIIIKEYNDSLSSINHYLNSEPECRKKTLLINYFITNNIFFEKVGLELIPIFIEIKSLSSAYLLQPKILRLLCDTSLLYKNWLHSELMLNNIVLCLHNSKAQSKIIVVQYLSKIIQNNVSEIKKNFNLHQSVVELFSILENVLCANTNNDETDALDNALIQLFDSIVESKLIQDNYQILQKCENICYHLIRYKLKKHQYGQSESILISTMRLITHILLYENKLYSKIDFILDHAMKSKSCDDVYIILQYQIFQELRLEIKDNIIDASLSPTWKILHTEFISNVEICLESKVHINALSEMLYFMKSIINTIKIVCFMLRENNNEVRNLQIVFFPIEDIINNIRQIINMYNINTSVNTKHCLDFISDILSDIISFTYFRQQNFQDLKIMLEMICYPFCNIRGLNINVKHLISDDFLEKNYIEKQIKALEILSICLINVDSTEKAYLNEIQNWILTIFKFCATSKNEPVLMQVSHKLINILCTAKGATSILYEILKQLLNSNNMQVLQILSVNLGKIICVLSGNYIITSKLTENCIIYEVDCLQCDFTKKTEDSTNDGLVYRVSDKKPFSVYKFTVERNFMQTADVSIMLINILDSNDVKVKTNIVEQLPRFAKHVQQFHSISVTKKWLKFMEDEDKAVRCNFVRAIRPIMDNIQSNSSLTEEYKDNLLELCLKSISSATEEHLRSGNSDLILTLLDTIKEFGCLNNPEVIFKTTKLILFYVILCSTSTVLTAIDHLKEITKSHKITPTTIFHKYKKNLCKYIVAMSVYAYVTTDSNIVQILDRIAHAFGLTMKELLPRNGHHLLPYFIPHFVKHPKSLKILNDIANLMAVEATELVVNHFSYIYTHVYLNEDEETFKNCMDLIETITNSHIHVLKKRSIKVIHNELLMHFHDKRELVLKELYKLSVEDMESISSDRSSSTSSRVSDKNQIIFEYLQPRFLGVLVYFDTKLVSKSVDDTVKIRVLQSLPLIIKLMGTKFITSLRHKVLATLRTALSLTEKKYLELTCANWDAFVHCCEVESLGPLLSTIFVSILPLLHLFPRKVNSIFKYLIIENEDKLKDYIQDLFLLTDTKVDYQLKTIIKNHVNLNVSCKELLEIFLKYISHENLEVRFYGLKFLKKHLEQKRLDLEELILGTNGMHPVLNEVIEVLIAGCLQNDEQVKLACGKTIGELGAIEPSHFPRKFTTQSDSTFTFYLTDDAFVINALLELLRSFQMEKHTQNMNRFALAIQEILKVYGVSPEENAPKRNIWNYFSENMQELMRPLLSSRYTVATQSTDKITIHPVFGSHIGSTSNDWIYNWTSHLISLLVNDKKKLLQVCKPSLRHDYRTLMIFLPHILLHAILESSDEERQKIFAEFMAVMNFSDGQKYIDPKYLKYQPIITKQYSLTNMIKKSDDTSKSNCIKVIFVLLDYLDRWLREYECQKCTKLSNPMLDMNYKKVHMFVAQFCKLKIARCNFLRGEYPRALMYLEQYVSNAKNKLNDQLGFFARIYAELEEPDGVAGAMAMKQTDPSIEDMILAHNVFGQLQDAAACYEKMAQERTLQPEYLQDRIRCYLELDNPHTAMDIASANLEKYADYDTMLYECQAEPYWRLGSYDELETLLKKPEMRNNTNWGVRLGHVLLHFRKGNRLEFKNEISNIEKMLIEMLSITSLEEGVYTHGYPHIIKLHILNELEKAEETLYNLKEMADKSMCERTINELVTEWDLRLKVIQSSVQVVEPVLRIRRIMLEQIQYILGPQSDTVKLTLDKHIAKYWLKSAEIARKAGIFQQAYIYILKAEQYKPKELFIEKAKFYWAKEDQDQAFSTLKRGIEEYFPDANTFKDMDSSLRKIDRKLCAEAKLLIATYNDDTSNVDMDVNITNYREAVDMYREWEKSQVCLAQYYDRVFSTMSDADKDIKGGDIQIHIINCFGKSLQYGSTYIYQSMPRMLSIWLDYGTRIVESRPTDSTEAKETKKSTLYKMIKLIDTYLDRLPAYMFLSAFSQLVSRICHPVREVYVQIKSILIKLILKYPQQSMWMIMSVSKSAYAMRTKRCQEVLQDDRIKNSNVLKLIYDFNRLAEKLIELCNKPISDGVLVTTVNTLIRTLPRLLQNKDFSQIMVPIQRLRKLVLPNPEFSNSQYDPFPNNMVYIVNIENEIQVLQSLQRPRKITFTGSDGKKYVHMLKPKDDLRKDSRLMEFNDVVNLYLHRESESRERRLFIRTYSVVPLNEECGLIEWIDNLVGLRPILMKIYKQRGLYVSARELKSMMCNVRDPLSKKRDVFEKQLLPKHPPVLGEWFRRTFPDAHSWYNARTVYIRTSAVMSMVGYVLGLGDRHGENILFDSTNGDTVHVDFNCLFNKGETFDWPERVPFRLTHNMVDAMGPLGVEGIFRRTSAITLKVLRTHIDTLMSIVRPFVYDPLVSWPRNQLLKSDTSEAERTNEQAVEHIKNIELRLEGMLKTRGKSFSISLSCEGQANNLIAEATNIDNLSQMYIGWGPFL